MMIPRSKLLLNPCVLLYIMLRYYDNKTQLPLCEPPELEFTSARGV